MHIYTRKSRFEFYKSSNNYYLRTWKIPKTNLKDIMLGLNLSTNNFQYKLSLSGWIIYFGFEIKLFKK